MISPLAKHTFNSVRKKWWQPLILVITIVFSMILLNFMYECITAINNEEDLRNKQETGNSHIIIEYSGEEFGGAMSSDDLEKYLDKNDVVSGFYSLLLNSDDKKNIMCAGADFYTIDEMFDFEFIEYGKITTGSLNSSLLITKQFAKENNLKIGDKYNLYVFGQKKEYIIQGISKTPFMVNYDLLINIDGLLGILASKSPVFAGFDKDNLPYSKIYIQLAQPQNIQQVYDTLDSLNLDNCEVYISDNNKAKGLTQQIFWIILFLMQFLISVLSIILIYSILCIIVDYRENDERALVLAGASHRSITFALAAELLLYTVIGWLLGLIFSRLLIDFAGNWIVFNYVTLGQTAKGAFFGLALETAIVIFALILHNLHLKKIARKSDNKILGIIIAVLIAIIVINLLLLMFVSPEKFVYISIIDSIVLFLLMSAGIPWLIKGITGAINKSSALQKAPAGLVYAVKNTLKVKALQNFCRMLSIVITIVVCLGVVLNYGINQSKTNFFNCDYVIVNNTPQLQDSIENLADTQSCSKLMFCSKARFNNGRMLNLISIDDKDYLTSKIDVEKLPVGNEIVLPKSIGILYRLQIGDSIEMNLDNKKLTFKITEFLDNIDFVGLVDNEYLGYGQNYLLIRSDATDSQQYRLQLQNLADENFAIVGDSKLIVDLFQQRAKLFIVCATVFFVLSLVISLSGMINNLCVSYRNRKKELYYYSLAGMTKSDIRKMIVFELIIVSVAAIIISSLAGGYLIFSINKALNSYGYML